MFPAISSIKSNFAYYGLTFATGTATMGACLLFWTLALHCASVLGSESESDSSSMYAEYDQNLYCDAIRCISPNGTRLRHGTIVRADTCDAFCMCTGSRVVRFDCPASLHYNEKTERCDYPQLAQCKPEFLSEESLKLYELYNPGKLLKQGYEAENWRHLWKCMDKFNNVTRQNETQEESSAEQNGDFESAGKAVMDSIDKLKQNYAVDDPIKEKESKHHSPKQQSTKFNNPEQIQNATEVEQENPTKLKVELEKYAASIEQSESEESSESESSSSSCGVKFCICSRSSSSSSSEESASVSDEESTKKQMKAQKLEISEELEDESADDRRQPKNSKTTSALNLSKKSPSDAKSSKNSQSVENTSESQADDTSENISRPEVGKKPSEIKQKQEDEKKKAQIADELIKKTAAPVKSNNSKEVSTTKKPNSSAQKVSKSQDMKSKEKSAEGGDLPEVKNPKKEDEKKEIKILDVTTTAPNKSAKSEKADDENSPEKPNLSQEIPESQGSQEEKSAAEGKQTEEKIPNKEEEQKIPQISDVIITTTSAPSQSAEIPSKEPNSGEEVPKSNNSKEQSAQDGELPEENDPNENADVEEPQNVAIDVATTSTPDQESAVHQGLKPQGADFDGENPADSILKEPESPVQQSGNTGGNAAAEPPSGQNSETKESENPDEALSDRPASPSDGTEATETEAEKISDVLDEESKTVTAEIDAAGSEKVEETKTEDVETSPSPTDQEKTLLTDVTKNVDDVIGDENAPVGFNDSTDPVLEESKEQNEGLALRVSNSNITKGAEIINNAENEDIKTADNIEISAQQENLKVSGPVLKAPIEKNTEEDQAQMLSNSAVTEVAEIVKDSIADGGDLKTAETPKNIEEAHRENKQHDAKIETNKSTSKVLEKEDKSDEGDILVKLRSALQGVYEKASNTDSLLRSNRKHVSYKKRIRLERDNSLRTDEDKRKRDMARKIRMHQNYALLRRKWNALNK